MAQPDPNTQTLWLQPGGDLVISNTGGLVMATGSDHVTQRILRRLTTNPLFTLGDGTIVPPDYIYHPDYGIGAGRIIGELSTPDLQQRVQQLINQGVMIDEGVDSTSPPTIVFFADNDYLYASITINLLTGESNTFVLQIKQ